MSVAVTIVPNDHECSFEELFKRSNSLKTHKRNLHGSAIEVSHGSVQIE